VNAATIPSVLAAAADQHGDAPAIVDGELRLTYAELDDEARRVGAAFVAAGIEPGDRVSIWAPNSGRWIVAAFGLWHAGAVLVPVNTRFKGFEAAQVMSRAGVRALLTVTDFLGTDHLALLAGAGIDLPRLETTVVIDGRVPASALSWDAFMASGSAAASAVVVGPDDTSDILFTSGTTGVPKGVVQTHTRTLQVASDWVAMTGLHAGDRYLMVNPYFHMFGLKAGILASVVAAATMLPEPVFDVDRALQRVEAERVTVLPGAPTLYQSILDHPGRDRYDLSSLRIAVTGAADIPVQLIRRVVDELPFPTIITGYGLTEGGTASATSADDDVETIATTVGRPRPSFEMRIVDGNGNDVPAGESGEILLRGASVMSHYLDDPDATAAVLSDDGWLRTGDLGALTDGGCLRIVGRAKDMFIVGGFNAYPAEIENLLNRHPDVQQVAVIGIPDARLGEVGMAFVVLGAGAAVTSDELIAWSREHMANYKVPRAVEFIEELPLNATGKVEKNVLRERAAKA
jgi:acyl-CoA synthetase (AMP-forming)/AMP-acid ligase II